MKIKIYEEPKHTFVDLTQMLANRDITVPASWETAVLDRVNPPGWDDIDGVKLPTITWNERRSEPRVILSELPEWQADMVLADALELHAHDVINDVINEGNEIMASARREAQPEPKGRFARWFAIAFEGFANSGVWL